MKGEIVTTQTSLPLDSWRRIETRPLVDVSYTK